MGKIRVLDATVANRIAAGEVVERPASVVKELVENSLDARAGRLEIAIDGGGKNLIRVADDGEGLLAEDVRPAFERHATSKLRSERDLDHIATLGFRGEALPSIASVSRLTLMTLAAGEDVGTRIDIVGGTIAAEEPCPFAQGTLVEIRDLFFNVPARRKFLKSTAAETGACAAVVLRAALAHPGVAFSFTSSGRQRYACPAADSARTRIEQVLGVDRAEGLLVAERAEAGVELLALVEPPIRHHATRGEQYVFINQRPVVDRRLQYGILRAFEGLLPGGRFPGCFVYLTVDSSRVDVNVHPAKTEVRFADPSLVQSLLTRALKEALARAGHLPQLPSTAHGGVHEAVEEFLAGVGGRPARPYRLIDPLGRPRQPPPATGDRPASAVAPATAGAGDRPGTAAEPAATVDAPLLGPCAGSEPFHVGEGLRVLGQFRRTFIIASDERGLILADQHTAHERVLFERIRRQRTLGECQRLLVPEVVEVSAATAAVLPEAADELAALGVELEPMGGRSFSVRSMPADVAIGSAKDLLEDIGRSLADGSGTGLEGRHHRVHATMACHAAVKVNMELGLAKLEWILRELLRCEDPYRCPHGRATILRMDDEAVKKSFGRYW